MEPVFDHEKLDVYQRSLEFIGTANPILKDIPKSSSTWDQLDRASTSIPLNIAEGNGKWSSKDRCRFFDVAHGSALECAAALDVSVAKGFLAAERVETGKRQLAEIVRMLIGLLKTNDPERNFGGARSVRDEGVDYGDRESRTAPRSDRESARGWQGKE